jgi:hypothetical protein
MRRWHSFSLCRRLAPLNRRPIHSSAQLAPTGSQPHFDSQTSVTANHDASSTPSSSKSSSTSAAPRHPNKLQHGHTLTVLHTARELIARILPPQSVELSFWNDVLCDVSNEICCSSLISKEDKVTIIGAFWVCNSQLGGVRCSSSFAVYPVDEFSGGESVVSALLQDPFCSEAESVRITSRWEGHEQNTRLDLECAGCSSSYHSF